jgi:sugar-specific transcriptional regulator TrmB
MRQVTASEKFKAVNEGKLAKSEFVRQMRQLFPNYISPMNGFTDSVRILKNRGLINEETGVDTYDSRYDLNISSDSIDRGVRYELQGKGIDPTDAKQEDFDKVKDTVIKNLKKDPLHYILLVSGESSKVDKNDKPKEVKRGAADKDTFNDLKKANLKEGYTEEQINSAI